MQGRERQPPDVEAGEGPDGANPPGPPSFTYEGVEPVVAAGVSLDDGRADAEAGASDQPDDADVPAKGRRKPKKKRHRYEWLILVVISLVVAVVVRAFLIQAFYIPSESMYPTLKTNDRVLVNKMAYRLGDVERGDIIVFHAPPNAATNGVKDLIKRVVGLPGERIEGRDGIVYINGKPLDEPYLQPDVRSTTFGPGTSQPIKYKDKEVDRIPTGTYFMMGDNRQGSRDSTKFGPIDEDEIVGRAFVKIWPVSDIGLL